MVEATVDLLLKLERTTDRPPPRSVDIEGELILRAARPAYQRNGTKDEGFRSEIPDFPDYIIGITKEIWEDRRIATLHDYLRPRHRRALARLGGGRQRGRDRGDDGDAGRVSRPGASGRGRDLVGHARDGDAELSQAFVHGHAYGRWCLWQGHGQETDLPHPRGLPRQGQHDRRRMADPRPGRHRAPTGLGAEGFRRRSYRTRGRRAELRQAADARDGPSGAIFRQRQ